MFTFSESHGEEEDDEAEDEDDGDEAEEVGEENDRPYNLRQRKTVQRYEAPPIGKGKTNIISCFLFYFLLFLQALRDGFPSPDSPMSVAFSQGVDLIWVWETGPLSCLKLSFSCMKTFIGSLCFIPLECCCFLHLLCL